MFVGSIGGYTDIPPTDIPTRAPAWEKTWQATCRVVDDLDVLVQATIPDRLLLIGPAGN
jgi:hypothetical protein